MDVDRYNSDDERNDFFGNDYFDDEPTIAEEAEEVPSDEAVLKRVLEKGDDEILARKRIVRNPQPKLNDMTMIGPKGIQGLMSTFKGYHPDQKKDPYQNLDVLLKKYENWSHVLFPKMKFDDVISTCETLGNKSRVKVYMQKVRLDMPLTDEDFAPTTSRKDEVITTETNEDEGVITTRDESDDENYYDPFEKKKSFAAKSPEAKKTSAPVIDEDDMIAAAEEAEREMQQAAEEEARRQFEMEADDMMGDFDY